MAKYYEAIDMSIKNKKDFAILHYMINNGVFTKGKAVTEENEKLNCVLNQIEVCEGMLIPLSTQTIIDWLENKTIHEIERAARKLKFAS